MIKFEGASFDYGGAPVLAGLDLTLEPGSLHFLTGRSGAGKTTLLKLLYLALTPKTGTVRVFGRDTSALGRGEVAAMRRRMGIVMQDSDLLDHMRVIDNIALPLRVAGADPAEQEADLRELINWVGLGERMEAYPRELSAGETQRAVIARAVVASPDLILADEPTGNIDAEAADRVMRLLGELNALGKTVLIATHDLSLPRAAKATWSARTLKLENGALVQAGASL